MGLTAESCAIVKKETLAAGVFSIWVKFDPSGVAPGQFAMLGCDGFLLRRPISICDLSFENGLIRLVFEVRGEGTRWLSGLKEGEHTEILAPLGNGFNLGDLAEKSAVIVAGGIGTPPMLLASKCLKGRCDVILGFRSAGNIILAKEFEKNGSRVTVVTEDGSSGEKGLVTGTLRERLDSGGCDVILACGPRGMLAGVAQEAKRRGIPCLVSMEERMACGVGACQGCAIRIMEDGREKNLRVCRDGPVFAAEKVVW